MKKYELTTETLQFAGRTLHRIKALRDFGSVKAGQFGGWIENEKNLSQDDNAWIDGEAMVFDNARVFVNAKVFGYAKVYDFAEIYGNVRIYGNASIKGDAKIHDAVDYIVFKNFWSSGRYFTWTRSNNMWSVGCFYGIGEELINKAYNDSEISGKEYERVVRYVESILADEKKRSN